MSDPLRSLVLQGRLWRPWLLFGARRRTPIHLCYVDESGKAELLTRADREQQPVIVIAGVIVPEGHLYELTHRWIELKARFNPSVRKAARNGWLDAILQDVKGAKLRKGFKMGATNRQQKSAIGMVDGALKLLEQYECKIVGRIWIKALDRANDEMPIHQSSLQFICAAFDAQIPASERGMLVVDSQTYWHNHQLAHAVFTQRFSKTPKHIKLADMPTFGHSDNHAGLQIADFICSAVLAPVASSVYAGAYASWNVHCDSGFLDIRDRFGERLEALTYRWHNEKLGQQSSSIVVRDPINKRSSDLMWAPGSRRRRGRRGGSPRTRRPKG